MQTSLTIKYSLFAAICFIVLSVSSCKDKTDDYIVDYGYEYFPMDSGHYVIYDVDSIIYRNADPQAIDSIRFQLKEFYAGTFFDSIQNQLKYRVEYQKRDNENAPWQNERVWYAVKEQTNVQMVENDIKFIKLIFPPRENTEWDGNIYAAKTGQYQYLNDWTYTYLNVDKPATVNGLSFDKTLMVSHVGDSNLIELLKSREMYAKGVGLIYKEFVKMEKQDVSSTFDDPKKNTEGVRVIWQVSSHNP
jgi:hypothetical protein